MTLSLEEEQDRLRRADLMPDTPPPAVHRTLETSCAQSLPAGNIDRSGERLALSVDTGGIHQMALMTHPVQIAWSYGTGSPGANVWHLRSTGSAIGGADAQSMSDIIKAFYQDIAGYFPTGVTIDFLGTVTGLGDDLGDSATLTPWQVVGTGGTGRLSSALQLVVSWKSNTGGRKGRGRTFIGPLNSGLADGSGVPTSAGATDLQAAAEDLIEASDSFANGAIVVYSKVDGLARDVTQATVARKFGVLRSRRD